VRVFSLARALALGAGVPLLFRFQYAYVGLPALDAFEYVQRKDVLGAALAALMRVPPERRAILKAQAEQRVAVSRENEVGKRMLSECIDAYLSLEGTELEEYNRLIGSETYEEARTMAQTTFEKGIERGFEMARATFEKGQRAVLLRQLERRFGALAKTHANGWTRRRPTGWPTSPRRSLRRLPSATRAWRMNN
jgi:hypothetical protein